MNEKIAYSPMAVGATDGSGFGGSGILGLIALISLLRNNGILGNEGAAAGGNVLAGDIAAQVVSLQNSADLKGLIQNVESQLQLAMQNQSNDLNAQFNAIQQAMCTSEVNALKASYESTISQLNSTNNIMNKIGDETQAVQAQMTAFQVSNDRQFCAVDNKISNSTQLILSQLAADKLDSKNDEIALLRARTNSLETNINFGSQFNMIASQLNNLSQKQDLTNQTIQFGTGNVSTPTATNNQVR